MLMTGPSAPRQLTWLIVGSNGVHLSWLPPAEPNGVISAYVISYCSGVSDAMTAYTTTAANCHTQNVHGESVQRSPRAGSGVVRVDPLHFLAGCCTRRLNQALSVLSLSRGFFLVCVVLLTRASFYVVLYLCYLCVLSVGCSC